MAINLVFHSALRLTALACLAALAICFPLAAADIVIRPIALTGKPTPDGNGLYSSFQAADDGLQLNDAGQVAFLAWLTGTSGGDADNGGIFRSDGGPIVQMTRFRTFVIHSSA